MRQAVRKFRDKGLESLRIIAVGGVVTSQGGAKKCRTKEGLVRFACVPRLGHVGYRYGGNKIIYTAIADFIFQFLIRQTKAVFQRANIRISIDSIGTLDANLHQARVIGEVLVNPSSRSGPNDRPWH